MPDITMCMNDDCYLAKLCYRHEATPTPRRQSYSAFAPDRGVCTSFWQMEGRYHDGVIDAFVQRRLFASWQAKQQSATSGAEN